MKNPRRVMLGAAAAMAALAAGVAVTPAPVTQTMANGTTIAQEVVKASPAPTRSAAAQQIWSWLRGRQRAVKEYAVKHRVLNKPTQSQIRRAARKRRNIRARSPMARKG